MKNGISHLLSLVIMVAYVSALLYAAKVIVVETPKYTKVITQFILDNF